MRLRRASPGRPRRPRGPSSTRSAASATAVLRPTSWPRAGRRTPPADAAGSSAAKAGRSPASSPRNTTTLAGGSATSARSASPLSGPGTPARGRAAPARAPGRRAAATAATAGRSRSQRPARARAAGRVWTASASPLSSRYAPGSVATSWASAASADVDPGRRLRARDRATGPTLERRNGRARAARAPVPRSLSRRRRHSPDVR